MFLSTASSHRANQHPNQILKRQHLLATSDKRSKTFGHNCV